VCATTWALPLKDMRGTKTPEYSAAGTTVTMNVIRVAATWVCTRTDTTSPIPVV
jgi:hypothetical protein